MTEQPEPEDPTGYLEPDPPIRCLNLTAGPDPDDWPSRRTGLRDQLAAAIWERQNPGRRWADCERPWGADAEEDADAVLAVLYREWPWLRAEAEDAEPAATEATDGQPCDPELTAEEARALADDLGLSLYYAQDALDLVAERCDLADQKGHQPTTAEVRQWLKGARCARQLAAEQRDRTTVNNPPTSKDQPHA